MQIVVWSKQASELLAYGQERLLRWPLAALWAIHLGLSFGDQTPTSWREGLARGLLTGLLIAQFRLGDDLADLDHDARIHPTRVLTRSLNLRPFQTVLCTIALPIMGLLWASPNPLFKLAAYAGLIAGLMWVYGRSSAAAPGRRARNQLVLLKYPVFLLLCSPKITLGLAISALVLYVIVTAYDWRTTSP